MSVPPETKSERQPEETLQRTPTKPLGRTPQALFQVVAFELILPLFVGALLLRGWIDVWTPDSGFWAGRARVWIGDEMPGEEDASVEWIVPADTMGSSLAAQPFGEFPRTGALSKRYRLGDVFRVEDGVNVSHAAIYDPELRIVDQEAPRESKAEAGWPLISAAHAGDPEEAPIQRKPLDPKRPPPKQSGTSNPGPDPPAQGSGVPTRAVHPSVVVSAAVNALLQAEYAGVHAVVFVPHRSIDGELYAPTLRAIHEGIERVAIHLHSVREIYLPLPGSADLWSPTREPEDSRRARLIENAAKHSLTYGIAARLVTPLAWPGGVASTYPQTVSAETPANERFSPARLATPATTAAPALLFVLALAVAAIGNLRAFPPGAVRFRWRGAAAAAASVLMAYSALHAMHGIWRAAPGFWIATEPGIWFVAAVLSLLIGCALAALRGSPLPEPVIAGRDDAMRSALHSDRAVEDLAEDRLGFRPIVKALARFLDNPDTAPPVVISVNGPWGSGKSSLMKMLAAELRQTRRFQIVWYNAWQYHTQDQILAAFLHSVATQLARGWTPLFAMRLAWTRFTTYSFGQYLALLSALAVLMAAVLVSLGAIDAGEVFRRTASEAQATGELAAPLLSALGLGGIAWLHRFLRPFQLQFKRLYAVSDHSARIGFLEEFTREFRMYREAVGSRQKFLIIIDDLDRCPPEHVVDVLKTINLIITSGEGAGRSFFLLGYDPKYILRSIETYYRELGKGGSAIDQRFGPEYLKKMVTVSVSVPVAEAREIQEMVERIDGPPSPEAAAPKHREMAWIRRVSVPDWLGRLSLALLTLLVLSIPVLISTRAPEDGVTVPSSERAASEGTSAEPSDRRPASMPTTTTEVPEDGGASAAPSPWWWWLPLALPLGIGFAAVALLARRAAVEERYAREPTDSQRFLDSIKSCSELLPRNPRDVVRTINLMRMEYLVQAAEADAERGRGGAGSGPRLDEWECVSYTLLQQRHPEYFDPAFLQENVLPRMSTAVNDVPGLFREIDRRHFAGNANGASMAGDVAALERAGAPLAHLADGAKLKRFVDINWFVLDVGWRPEPQNEKQAECDAESSEQATAT